MRRLRPAVAVSAALVLLAAPLVAAVDAAPAQATAASGFTLLDLSLGSTSVQVLDVALASSAASAPSFAVTPLRLNGTPVLSASPPVGSAVDVPDSGDLLPGSGPLASMVVPPLGYTVTGPRADTGTFTLPQVSALGMPISMDGTVAMSSTASESGSEAVKTVEVRGLSMPSVADLLASRGVDVSTLPLDVLRDLVTRLDIATPAFTTAAKALTTATASLQTQVTAAQAQVDAARAALLAGTGQLSTQQAALARAEAELAAAVAAVAPLESALTAAQSAQTTAAAGVTAATAAVTSATAAVNAATAALTGLLGLAGLAPSDPLVQALRGAESTLATAQSTLTAATTAVTDATTALATAQGLVGTLTAARNLAASGVTTLQTTVTGLQTTLDNATATLAGVLSAVPAELAALTAASLVALDATPLLALDQLLLTTRAATSTGSQTAEMVTGQVRGLRVLGLPVVGDLALSPVTGPVETLLDSTLASATTTLSGVLGRVGIVLPAPAVDLLARSTTTDDAGGLGSANTTLSALTLTWPALTVPGPYASGPASSLLTLRIATLREAATYRVAVAGTTAPEAAVDPSPSASSSPGASATPAPPAAPAPVDAAPVDLTPPTDPDVVLPAPVVAAPVDAALPAAPAPADPDAPPGEPVPAQPAPPSLDRDLPPANLRVPPAATPVQPRTPPVSLTHLPRTGMDSEPSVLALLLVAAALGLHRRYRIT